MAEEKILDNEKLDDDQLENVAGGTQDETDFDRIVMFQKKLVSSPNATKDELKAAFASLGIVADLHGGRITSNRYTLPNGQKVDNKAVWAYIAATGK